MTPGMTQLAGQIVWLTGASSGIGEALALRLGRERCRVAITARRAESLEALAARIREAGGEALALPGDVQDRERMVAIVTEIGSKWGVPDLVVTCAGTYLPSEMSDGFQIDEYLRIMRLNFDGTLNAVAAALPAMRARRRGRLAIVSSLVGYRGLPRAAAYGASKAALINFFESARFHLERDGVGVTIVNPGFVKTPLTDKNDFEMPFLVSAEESAERIVEGLRRGKKEIHYPWQLSWIFKFLRIIPYPLYHAMIRKQVLR